MRIEDRGISGVFLERAAAEQLGESLTSEGWEVTREAVVDDRRIDLVARRGGETVFYEFKLAGSSSPADWSNQMVFIQQLALRHKASFRLVLVRPPRETELEIENVERILYEALVERPPHQVADIAGHTLIDEVEGVDLTAIRISGSKAEIDGEANLGVTLQTGGGEFVSSETFPFTFSATLDLAQGHAESVDVHEVDTSSWYGDEDDFGEEDDTSGAAGPGDDEDEL